MALNTSQIVSFACARGCLQLPINLLIRGSLGGNWRTQQYAAHANSRQTAPALLGATPVIATLLLLRLWCGEAEAPAGTRPEGHWCPWKPNPGEKLCKGRVHLAAFGGSWSCGQLLPHAPIYCSSSNGDDLDSILNGVGKKRQLVRSSVTN